MSVSLSLVLIVAFWGLAAAAHATTDRARLARKARRLREAPTPARLWAADVCRRISEDQLRTFSAIALRDGERAGDFPSLN